MRRVLFAILIAAALVLPARASELTAPEPAGSAADYMPQDTMDLLAGFRSVLGKAIAAVRPDLKEAAAVCLGLMATVLLISILQSISEPIKRTANLAGTAAISAALLTGMNSMMPLATKIVTELCEYGKLLRPVMTSAMAAQGMGASSAALYTITALFVDAISQVIISVLVPGVYLFLALAIAGNAMREGVLKRLGETIKWCASWGLKTILTLFLSFMSITGVLSGTADTAAMKVVKTAISTAVPVVGGILSNATESVLVGAGLIKNAAGMYGIFAIIAIFLEPFLKIGIHYLMLKITGSLTAVFGCSHLSDLIGDFSTAMGLLLGMTGAVCILLLFSTVCFLKGVG